MLHTVGFAYDMMRDSPEIHVPTPFFIHVLFVFRMCNVDVDTFSQRIRLISRYPMCWIILSGSSAKHLAQVGQCPCDLSAHHFCIHTHTHVVVWQFNLGFPRWKMALTVRLLILPVIGRSFTSRYNKHHRWKMTMRWNFGVANLKQIQLWFGHHWVLDGMWARSRMMVRIFAIEIFQMEFHPIGTE